MNQKQGLYQVDTERTESAPHRITDALIVVAFVGVVTALIGGWL